MKGEPIPEEMMFERALKQMRVKIRTRQYVMTVHAEEERTGPSTTELSASQTQEYIKHRYKA